MARLTPICVPCKQAMRCEKNSFLVKDAKSEGITGSVWSGDKFKCPDCGTEVVVGFGKPRLACRVNPEDAKAMEFNRT